LPRPRFSCPADLAKTAGILDQISSIGPNDENALQFRIFIVGE
jgi:hypothetical protein